MAELKLTQMFRGTTRSRGILPKEQVLLRVKQLVNKLRGEPKWLLHGGFVGDLSGRYPGVGYDSAVGKGAGYIEETNGGQRSVLLEEKRKSSRIQILNLVGFPAEGGEIFRPFAKLKTRQQIRALWEFIMLDTWSRVLAGYAKQAPLQITAPQPLGILPEGETTEQEVIATWLLMTYCKGAIVNKLPLYELPRTVTIGKKDEQPFYSALAQHLGRLAHIKEAEGLVHGDFDLRHLLFCFGRPLRLKGQGDKELPLGTLPSLVSLLSWSFISRHDLPPTAPDEAAYRVQDCYDPVIKWARLSDGREMIGVNYSPVRLSVIDVEKSRVEQVGTAVKDENEKVFQQFLSSFSGRRSVNVKAYEDGYNALEPLSLIGKVETAQRFVYGFSFDHLF